SKTKRVDITDREKEIICLIAQGLTNGEIAKKLYLSEGTVKNYITNILSKLGAKNRASLIEIARKSGII
ncbi:MAG: response regulator transcription factor, partial [Candidatus Aenigmatarchaeota archaeon]